MKVKLPIPAGLCLEYKLTRKAITYQEADFLLRVAKSQITQFIDEVEQNIQNYAMLAYRAEITSNGKSHLFESESIVLKVKEGRNIALPGLRQRCNSELEEITEKADYSLPLNIDMEMQAFTDSITEEVEAKGPN